MGRGTPPSAILGVGSSKKYVLQKIGTVGELYEGKIKKMGKGITLDRILPRVVKQQPLCPYK